MLDFKFMFFIYAWAFLFSSLLRDFITYVGTVSFSWWESEGSERWCDVPKVTCVYMAERVLALRPPWLQSSALLISPHWLPTSSHCQLHKNSEEDFRWAHSPRDPVLNIVASSPYLKCSPRASPTHKPAQIQTCITKFIWCIFINANN